MTSSQPPQPPLGGPNPEHGQQPPPAYGQQPPPGYAPPPPSAAAAARLRRRRPGTASSRRPGTASSRRRRYGPPARVRTAAAAAVASRSRPASRRRQRRRRLVRPQEAHDGVLRHRRRHAALPDPQRSSPGTSYGRRLLRDQLQPQRLRRRATGQARRSCSSCWRRSWALLPAFYRPQARASRAPGSPSDWPALGFAAHPVRLDRHLQRRLLHLGACSASLTAAAILAVRRPRAAAGAGATGRPCRADLANAAQWANQPAPDVGQQSPGSRRGRVLRPAGPPYGPPQQYAPPRSSTAATADAAAPAHRPSGPPSARRPSGPDAPGGATVREGGPDVPGRLSRHEPPARRPTGPGRGRSAWGRAGVIRALRSVIGACADHPVARACEQWAAWSPCSHACPGGAEPDRPPLPLGWLAVAAAVAVDLAGLVGLGLAARRRPDAGPDRRTGRRGVGRPGRPAVAARPGRRARRRRPGRSSWRRCC